MRNLKKRLRAGLTVVALTASMACSNSDTAPSAASSTSSTQAAFSVAVRPSPVTATRCSSQCSDESSSKSFAFSAEMTIDLHDSASVGATVNSITLNATADGNAFSPLVLSSDDIKQAARTNHVDGKATLSVPMTILYSTASGSPNLEISLSAQITDDRSNQMTPTGQVSVH